MNRLQSFYAGIMLFFGLVSIFMYLIFRENVFIWFALVMFSFVMYFISLYGLTGLLFNHRLKSSGPLDIVIIVSCILLFSSLLCFYSVYGSAGTSKQAFSRLFELYLVRGSFSLRGQFTL